MLPCLGIGICRHEVLNVVCFFLAYFLCRLSWLVGIYVRFIATEDDSRRKQSNTRFNSSCSTFHMFHFKSVVFFIFVLMFCSCHHELETARIYGMLGSVDANTGDAQTGLFMNLSCLEFRIPKLLLLLVSFWVSSIRTGVFTNIDTLLCRMGHWSVSHRCQWGNSDHALCDKECEGPKYSSSTAYWRLIEVCNAVSKSRRSMLVLV